MYALAQRSGAIAAPRVAACASAVASPACVVPRVSAALQRTQVFPLQQHLVAQAPCRKAVVVKAAADGKAEDLDAFESVIAKVVGPKNAKSVVTVGFILVWYALNVAFNLLNKSIFKYFPFPWTVSTVHVIVGLVYCVGMYAIGLKEASFGRIITKKEFGSIFGPASMHAIGHIAANLSFAAVAISLTHTVKTLEPAFNVVLSSLILGQNTPLPAILSLIPIMVGVGLASAAELSFNWMGFLTAMASNLTFGFRAVWSKMAMSKDLGSTCVYAYTTLISVIICTPLALMAEGGSLKAGADAAIAKVGATQFWGDLFMVGLLYHLYNQFAFNTLQRVSPVSHGVCNVVKRIAIIFSSVIFFHQTMSTQTMVGTCVAIFGTYLYTQASGHAHKADKPKTA